MPIYCQIKGDYKNPANGELSAGKTTLFGFNPLAASEKTESGPRSCVNSNPTLTSERMEVRCG